MGRGVRARCLPGTAPPLEPFSPPPPPCARRTAAPRGAPDRAARGAQPVRLCGRGGARPGASPAGAHRLAVVCAVCRIPVRGLAASCARCGHGGHVAHIRPWFAKYAKCATVRRFTPNRSPPPPSSRTKWTRSVPHPVLIGHAALQSAALRRTALQSAALCTEPLYNERPVRRRQRRALTGARAQGCGCTCYLEGGLELG